MASKHMTNALGENKKQKTKNCTLKCLHGKNVKEIEIIQCWQGVRGLVSLNWYQ